MNILIVEDSVIVLSKLKAILTRLGYTVSDHNNSLKALEWLKRPERTPDMIIVDVSMPEMSGYDFVRSVRGLPACSSIPILLLTSQSEEEDRSVGLQAGADDYISKTITPNDLDARIKALLARPVPQEEITARTITVFSLRGGIGTTTMSVNLAVALAQMWGVETYLWDMALSGGHCSLFLNLRSKRTPAALADLPVLRVDDEIMEDMLLQHETGIRLVPAPSSVAETELITEKTIDLVFPYLQTKTPYLVIDAGNHFTDPVLSLLEQSDMILVMLSPELASVISAADALKILNSLGIDPQKIHLVLNRTFPNFTLPVNKIIPLLGNRTPFEIPYDSDTIVQSIHSGKPFMLTNPKSDLASAVTKLAYRLSMTDMEPRRAGYSSHLLERARQMAGGG